MPSRRTAIWLGRYSFAGDAGKAIRLRLATGALAEVRAIKETTSTFVEMTPPEQLEWVNELLERIIWPDVTAPSVCLLDTGVNNGHMLIEPALSDDDMHTFHPDWPRADIGLPFFHGTGMAGIALYGDLMGDLQSTDPVELNHKLESVRILAPKNDTPEDLYGIVTTDAVSQVEIAKPERERIFCLAITADADGIGRPSLANLSSVSAQPRFPTLLP